MIDFKTLKHNINDIEDPLDNKEIHTIGQLLSDGTEGFDVLLEDCVELALGANDVCPVEDL